MTRSFSFQEGVTKLGLMTQFANLLDDIENGCHESGVYPAWDRMEIRSDEVIMREQELYSSTIYQTRYTNVEVSVPAVRINRKEEEHEDTSDDRER